MSTKNIDLVQFGHASEFTRKRSPNVEVSFFRHIVFTHKLKQIVNRLSKYLWGKSLYVAYLLDNIGESNAQLFLPRPNTSIVTLCIRMALCLPSLDVSHYMFVHMLYSSCSPRPSVSHYSLFILLWSNCLCHEALLQRTHSVPGWDFSTKAHAVCGVSGWVVVRQTAVTSR